MRLTKSEMNLENLESSSAYDGAMINDCLLFRANTNISRKQSVPLIQEVVRRCNSQPDLLIACQAWLKVESEMADNNPCPDYVLKANYRKKAIKLTEIAINKAKT